MSLVLQKTSPTGTRATRVIGVVTILVMAWVVVSGLIFTPQDVVQGESVRIMYVHVPSAWIAYLAFIVTAVASAGWLFGKKHSMGFDRFAGASAEVGVMFMAITLITGSLWGRLTWGEFWQWDPRLTTTAFLFVTYLGYLAVRRLDGSKEQRARRSAVVAMLAVLEIPLVHFSVVLWRSLHQGATVLNPSGDVKMDGLMLFTLFSGVVGFTLVFVWLVLHRQRTMLLVDIANSQGLDAAIATRRAEGVAS
ncbi:MAG: cytochrome c biogenesis protein CcsA [Ilumatobacteraceae bacterium]|jgi:heme exporter protein C|nr:cytochrome c biogenesis protein CcsA [Ilumatobacteraceae bacterium]